jgi:hypothetical protein
LRSAPVVCQAGIMTNTGDQNQEVMERNGRRTEEAWCGGRV